MRYLLPMLLDLGSSSFSFARINSGDDLETKLQTLKQEENDDQVKKQSKARKIKEKSDSSENAISDRICKACEYIKSFKKVMVRDRRITSVCGYEDKHKKPEASRFIVAIADANEADKDLLKKLYNEEGSSSYCSD